MFRRKIWLLLLLILQLSLSLCLAMPGEGTIPVWREADCVQEECGHPFCGVSLWVAVFPPFCQAGTGHSSGEILLRSSTSTSARSADGGRPGQLQEEKRHKIQTYNFWDYLLCGLELLLLGGGSAALLSQYRVLHWDRELERKNRENRERRRSDDGSKLD